MVVHTARETGSPPIQRQELSPIYFPPALWRRGNRDDLPGCRNFHHTGIRNTGPESLRHFRRTFKRALQRHIATGTYNPKIPLIVPIREDKRYLASVGVIYKLSRTVQVKGELRTDWLRSNSPGTDYTASAILVGLRLQR